MSSLTDGSVRVGVEESTRWSCGVVGVAHSGCYHQGKCDQYSIEIHSSARRGLIALSYISESIRNAKTFSLKPGSKWAGRPYSAAERNKTLSVSHLKFIFLFS